MNLDISNVEFIFRQFQSRLGSEVTNYLWKLGTYLTDKCPTSVGVLVSSKNGIEEMGVIAAGATVTTLSDSFVTNATSTTFGEWLIKQPNGTEVSDKNGNQYLKANSETRDKPGSIRVTKKYRKGVNRSSNIQMVFDSKEVTSELWKTKKIALGLKTETPWIYKNNVKHLEINTNGSHTSCKCIIIGIRDAYVNEFRDVKFRAQNNNGNEDYELEKWIGILKENSNFYRTIFARNEIELEKYASNDSEYESDNTVLITNFIKYMDRVRKLSVKYGNPDTNPKISLCRVLPSKKIRKETIENMSDVWEKQVSEMQKENWEKLIETLGPPPSGVAVVKA